MVNPYANVDVQKQSDGSKTVNVDAPQTKAESKDGKVGPEGWLAGRDVLYTSACMCLLPAGYQAKSAAGYVLGTRELKIGIGDDAVHAPLESCT